MTIAFSWNGFPQYAARLIRAAMQAAEGPCVAVGSRPSVPVEGMEEALGQPVLWVDADRPASWRSLGMMPPRVFIQSGWSYPAFSTLGREVKAAGGRVIGLSDANWRGDVRQLVLGPIGFRLLHRRHFDAMVVPGKQGLRLMRYFGMPASALRTGMLGADPDLFQSGPPLAERSKTFLFVGQFIARKDVLGLGRAFIRFSARHPEWTLRLVGSGDQRALIPDHPNIVVEDFVQPEDLADRYRSARFFVLPSRVEAWGLVVHEAAMCGCALLLSDAIGSGDDLADADNAIRYKAGDEAAIEAALESAAGLTDADLLRAEIRSRTFGRQFGPEVFANAIADLVNS